MKPVILFRKDQFNTDEYDIAAKYFDIVQYRCECRNDFVIPRYSSLPYYNELEFDLMAQGCPLINTYEQHKFVANFEYYDKLKEYTPETWDDLDFYGCSHKGPFVVKGKTNSRKARWDKMMFAPTKRDALIIGCDLMNDPAIAEQGIIYRKYVPLETYEVGLNGLPFTNEWRYFFYKGNYLSHGYYWSNAEIIPCNTSVSINIDVLAHHVAQIIKNDISFVCIDVAMTVEGNPILIELNDGTMSGLSKNSADTLYSNLFNCLTK